MKNTPNENTPPMPITTRFENHNRKPLTGPQEATLYYYKVFEDNGIILKKEEYSVNKKNNYSHHEMVAVLYYLQNDETEIEAIEALLEDYVGIDELITVKTENLHYHTKETQKFHNSEGVYDGFMKNLLLDNNNCMIYEKEENYFKGVCEIEIRKYYFEDSNEVFEFIYNTKGELRLMRGYESPFGVENDGSITISEIKMFFPDFLSKNPYYKNGEMLP